MQGKKTRSNIEKSKEEFQLIMQELFDMRTETRDCQNQIFQVLSVAGTFIGILFGGGFIFGGDLDKLNKPLFGNPLKLSGIKKIIATYGTTARIIFLLNSIVFCVAISYILKLAITGIIAYFHVQDLQNRARKLMNDFGRYMDKNELVLWDEYKMTVMTMYPSHITNLFAAIHYIAYNIAMVFIMILCFAMTAIQYLLISDKQFYDNIGLIIVGITSLFCLLMTIYTSTRESDFFVKSIHDLAVARRTDKSKGNEIVHNITYLLYPRIPDMQKPLLIVGGAVIAYILGKCRLDWNLVVMMHRLFWTVIIFDFFVYQSRFLVNDIRGFEEDDHSMSSKKVRCNDHNKLQYIKASIYDICVRMIIAVLLLATLHNKLCPVFQIGNLMLNSLEIEIVVLLFITILYEAARSLNNDTLVYLLVGLGYPLRVVAGFMSAYPDVDPIKQYPTEGIILFIIGIYFLGVYSPLLAWVNDVITIRIHKGSNFKKHYYNDLNERIERSYVSAGKEEKRKTRNGFFPLREKGQLKEIWHSTFIACFIMFSLSMLMFLEGPYKVYFIFLELVVIIDLLLVAFWFEGINIQMGIRFSLALIMLKIIMLLVITIRLYKFAFIIITVFQALIIYIYYIQRYILITLNLKQFIDLIVNCLISIIFTKRVANQLSAEKRNK